MVPVMWYEGSVIFAKDNLDYMKFTFNTAPVLILITASTIFVLGAAMVFGTLVYGERQIRRAQRYKI